MELDSITPKLVERALSAWSRADEPPDELLQLEFLGVGGATERRFALHAFCLNTVTAMLDDLRRKGEKALIPAHKRDDLRRTIEEDFKDNLPTLQAWSAVYHRYLETDFRLSVAELEKASSTSESVFRERVTHGVRLLTEAIQRAEQRMRQGRLRAALPPREYQELVGIDDLAQDVAALVADPARDEVISIEGLGGIGKTTLVYQVAQRLNQGGRFAAVLWVSARQRWIDATGRVQQDPRAARTLADIVENLLQQLGYDAVAGMPEERRLQALGRMLASERFCIVLDNLETAQDVEHIVPTLYQHSGQSRLLLTSRASMRHLPYALPICVPELSFEDSRQLVESTLLRRPRAVSNLGAQPTMSLALMRRLYDLAGGVPLALKLVVSQPLPLAEILDDLARLWDGHGGHDPEGFRERIFEHVYRRTWTWLDEPARDLLIAMMDIAPEGEDVNWLRMVSGLPDETFRMALEALIAHSLVELGGDVETPRYKLHRLTVTFLETQLYRSFPNS